MASVARDSTWFFARSCTFTSLTNSLRPVNDCQEQRRHHIRRTVRLDNSGRPASRRPHMIRPIRAAVTALALLFVVAASAAAQDRAQEVLTQARAAMGSKAPLTV